MSVTDFDAGLDSAASQLSKLLAAPAADAPIDNAPAPEVTVEPKAVKTAQRNTVAPQPQESAEGEGPPSTEGEDGDAGESPSEAPASWDAEAKKTWAKLPDDVKAVISARETERESAVGTRLQEAAEVQKRAETEAAQTLEARNAYVQRLNFLARQLQSTIPEEFQTLKTPQDVQALAKSDPAAYVRFQAWSNMANGVLGELRAAEQATKDEAAAKDEAFAVAESKKLVEKWPEAADPVKGPIIRAEISSTLKGFGFSDQEISGITDHRILLFAKEHIAGQKAIKALEAAAKKLEGKPLPKVVRPGKGEGTGPAALTKAQLNRVAKSGDLGATQGALERMLSSSQ